MTLVVFGVAVVGVDMEVSEVRFFPLPLLSLILEMSLSSVPFSDLSFLDFALFGFTLWFNSDLSFSSERSSYISPAFVSTSYLFSIRSVLLFRQQQQTTMKAKVKSEAAKSGLRIETSSRVASFSPLEHFEFCQTNP